VIVRTGFVLGANFALAGQPSVGASGAIFGTHAAVLIDLLSHWTLEPRPKRKVRPTFLSDVVQVTRCDHSCSS
jgi:membrane associated rhomboid family serine protease